jgi:hypothetical protein
VSLYLKHLGVFSTQNNHMLNVKYILKFLVEFWNFNYLICCEGLIIILCISHNITSEIIKVGRLFNVGKNVTLILSIIWWCFW